MLVSDEGAQSSISAPPNFISARLAEGIDLLQASIRVPVWSPQADIWEGRKEAEIRRASDEGNTAAPFPSGWSFGPPGAESPLYVLPHGSGRGGHYPVLLSNEWLEIKMRRKGGAAQVFASVQVHAAYWWSFGDASEAVAALQGWVFDHFGSDAVLVPSRVDLCRDLGGVRASLAARSEITGYVRPHGLAYIERSQGEAVNAVTIGTHGSPLQTQLYDKAFEIASKGDAKAWMRDIWQANGWDGVAPVTRAEFRYSREFLSDVAWMDGDKLRHGVADLYDLLDALPFMWAYAASFVRQVRCGPDASPVQRHRAPLTPLWEAVAAPFQGLAGVRMPRRRNVAPKLDALLASALGQLSSARALLDDPDSATVDDLFDLVASAYAGRYGGSLIPFQEAVMVRSRRYAAVG